jgi:IS5 family transposase
MTLWNILVCGVIRLDLNCDFDRLHELVNNHITLREMLGHGMFDDVAYHHQTLKDNVSLLTPQLLDEINILVVTAGHVVAKKRKKKPCPDGHSKCPTYGHSNCSTLIAIT